jgi:hypothetical protein
MSDIVLSPYTLSCSLPSLKNCVSWLHDGGDATQSENRFF